jgi:hypothetical protein
VSRPPVAVPLAIVLALVATVGGDRPEAHKPITSPYTFNDDVFPILRDRCGRCHVAGGVAPMSLTTYKDAVPWGESIRTELISGHMPPGGVDAAAGKFKNLRTLTARELNVLLTWVTGGNPAGSAEHTPPPVAAVDNWRIGAPDLVLTLPEFALAAGVVDATQEFTLALPASDAKWLRAVDLLPGTPAMVRSATIIVRTSPSAVQSPRPDPIAAERLLTLWLPGDDPLPLDDTAVFHVPAGAELAVRIHYKKTWEYERLAMTDRSRVGVYFAPRPARELRALTVTHEPSAAAQSDAAARRDAAVQPESVTFGRTVEEDLDALALYPDAAMVNVTVRLDAIRPDGSRVDLIRFRPQPDWGRRYWFQDPIALPRGTRLEATVTFDEALLPPGAPPATRAQRVPLRLTVDVVASR